MRRRMPNTDSKSQKWWWLVGTAAALIVSYVAMPAYTDAGDAIGYMLRVTARVAFVLLMIAYLARPVRMLLGNVSWARSFVRGWLAHRRYVGLSMAMAHTVHFGYVVSLVTVLGQELDPVTMILGGLAFVLMWLMAATSNNKSVAVLSRNWRRLHLFGLHYLWLIFVQSFALIAASGGEMAPLYALLTLVGLIGLVLRGWVYWSIRFRRAR